MPLELPSEKKWIDRPVDDIFLFMFVSEYGTTRVQINLSYFLLYMLNRLALLLLMTGWAGLFVYTPTEDYYYY